jgi:hypothetical protein
MLRRFSLHKTVYVPRWGHYPGGWHKTCFMGSFNETYDAWKLHYELVWEDNVREGQPVTTQARFSFTYRLRDGRWMIVDHHSSAVPAPRQ